MMITRRIKCNLFSIMAMAILVTHSAIQTEARPQLQQPQQQQPANTEEAFFPEPSVQDPKTPVKITLLPFYGGAKGQTLQITETLDGTVSTEILQGQLPSIKPEEVDVGKNPVLPLRRESDYGQNIKNIHRSALNLIRLQEAAKNKGLNEEEEAAYKEHMDSLNQSAHNLAKIYEGDDDDADPATRAGLSGWFARKKTTKKENKEKDKDKKKEEEDKKKQGQKTTEEENKKKEEEAKKKAEEAKKKAEEAKKKADAETKRKAEEATKKKQEEEKKRKEEENKKKQEQEQQQAEEADEEIPAQQPETSVAEAKPVGLAVAGIGGVASSKPVATAVVGPGGLAIARPVGTAIAGVSPDQALIPIYVEGFVVPKPSASKDKKPSHSTDYLNKIISKYHQV